MFHVGRHTLRITFKGAKLATVIIVSTISGRGEQQQYNTNAHALQRNSTYFASDEYV
jgi:hypothetical protein